MNDDILSALSLGAFLLFITVMAMVGIYVSIFGDMRSFDNIKELCNQQGYIQNTETRIYCRVENETKNSK